ncbi:membrane protein [Apilactobacillus ozensis DSM 23829 = JCM 17196]|uniref:Membrane protein n=1 Tax=Apilactobacillus ozensis DSM 23829 = JCM 17196 TaxID=1423781 RepID=A0A0R2AMC1_9LACO|nr:ABC-2 family transporter protein [Apilactobacillus ozensis]KRM67618.1 membrane protein [Apilactobacillus ozensis DSM 23829 = JCM 17196]
MKYLIIGFNSLTAKLVYRSNEITYLLTQCLQMVISILMWISIYHGTDRHTLNNMALSQMIQYLVITNLTAILFSASPIFRMANQVKSGQLTTILLRPISIYGEQITYYVGSQFPYLCINFGLLLIYSNQSLQSKLILITYLTLAFIMFFTTMLVIGTLSFWLINMWPLRSAVNACYLILGGLSFPLTFLGKGIYKWLQFNPFSLVADVPARMVTHLINDSTPYFIAVSSWLIITLLIYRILIKVGIKKYEGIGI